MNCPECGNKILDVNQKFCEKCGIDLSGVEFKSDIKLFDNYQKYYIMTETYWKHGSGRIYNEKGLIIGSVHKKKKKRIVIKDSDDSILAIITGKSPSIHHIHMLSDPKGNIIAKYKKKMVSNFRSIFYLEDPEGIRKYEAYGEFMDFKFNIKDISTEKIIAEFDKVEKWKDEISSEILNFYDAYALKIKNSNIDHRMLLGFVLGSKYIIYDVF
ncbi:MAG: zinc ribbon domain-containing protein [Promethearchaeota archaeon]